MVLNIRSFKENYWYSFQNSFPIPCISLPLKRNKTGCIYVERCVLCENFLFIKPRIEVYDHQNEQLSSVQSKLMMKIVINFLFKFPRAIMAKLLLVYEKVLKWKPLLLTGSFRSFDRYNPRSPKSDVECEKISCNDNFTAWVRCAINFHFLNVWFYWMNHSMSEHICCGNGYDKDKN